MTTSSKKTIKETIVTEQSTDLGSIITTVKGRKIAYAVYALAGLVVTNVSVGFAATQTAFPAWLTVALAVIGNLATPFGAIAIANAKTNKK
jgi:hypothetical protein